MLITPPSHEVTCQNFDRDYYLTALEQKRGGYEHIDCSGDSWKGSSFVDPRPDGSNRYIDYLNGYATPERPSHGHYGRLPHTIVQDPTCEELQIVTGNICRYEKGGTTYSVGQICGMGTTWDAFRKQCVRMQDDYITYDYITTGLQHQRSVYPYIRSEGDIRCYDDPDDIYIYLNQEQLEVFDSSPHGTEDCTPIHQSGNCTANRCRFPLTSYQGQHQAELYVRLFREVYEYDGKDTNKLIRRTRMRTLIDNHWAFAGFHGDGNFLPWHRWYLLEMETILIQHQKESIVMSDCDKVFVGIPYFDWHNIPCSVIPRDFINSASFHNSFGEPTPHANPSYGCVGGALAGFNLTTGNCLVRSWRDTDCEKFPEINLHPLFPFPVNYNQFRDYLEALGPGLHSAVHSSVGGEMNTFRGANDPLFFAHHGNVDKIWYDWQTWSHEHQNAYSGSTPRSSIMPVSTATPADMLDLSKQIYTSPLGSRRTTISVEYVDMDTSLMMGDGNTFSR